jgi:hypothetical protein
MGIELFTASLVLSGTACVVGFFYAIAHQTAGGEQGVRLTAATGLGIAPFSSEERSKKPGTSPGAERNDDARLIG